LKDHQFIHHNLEYGIPMADESVDFAYSSHFLEHLTRADTLRLIDEVYRVLKQNGLLRIIVPDLAFAVSLYSKGERERMLDKYFFVDSGDSYFARHKYMYDFDSLKNILENAGFKDVVRCGYRHGKMPDLNVLDNRPEDSLFVEAIKA